MADEKQRQNWVYAEISADERATLRRMAKAEGKTVTELTQAIMHPALKAELDQFAKAEAEAKKKAEAEASAKAKESTNGTGTPQGAPAAQGQPSAAKV